MLVVGETTEGEVSSIRGSWRVLGAWGAEPAAVHRTSPAFIFASAGLEPWRMDQATVTFLRDKGVSRVDEPKLRAQLRA